MYITVQPKRLGQPSKNINVFVDFLFGRWATEQSSTILSNLKPSQFPNRAEEILSIDGTI